MGKNLLLGKKVKLNYFNTSELAFDPISVTNHKNLWHRGFPLQILNQRKKIKKIKKIIYPDIQADFWNGIQILTQYAEWNTIQIVISIKNFPFKTKYPHLIHKIHFDKESLTILPYRKNG